MPSIIISILLVLAGLIVGIVTMFIVNFVRKNSASNKADRILELVLEAGNFGHNNDVSYRWRYSGFIVNVITFFRRFRDFLKFTFIFPVDAPRFFATYVFGKIKGSDV